MTGEVREGLADKRRLRCCQIVAMIQLWQRPRCVYTESQADQPPPGVARLPGRGPGFFVFEIGGNKKC